MKNESIFKLNIIKSGVYVGIMVLFLAFFGCSQKTPVLYLIGDSTMANKEKTWLPEKGWGMMLPQWFSNDIVIENHAKNGRSTRSFIYEGRWDSVYQKLTEGDFVIIQFGHNDGSIQKTERYATPVEYEYNLRKFVRDTRQKGARPILATSIVRRKFDEQNQYVESHGEYPDIVRKVASELNVPLLEMHLLSRDLVTDWGAEKSKDLYLHIPPNVYDSLPDGLTDNTHFSELGANQMANIAVSEIRIKVPELAIYLKP